MVLSYAFCNTALAPMRAEPRHGSEMVNQLLFGDRVEVQEINENDWARIRCEWDGYEGWCKAGQLAMISKKEYRKEVKHITYGGKIMFEEDEMWLPVGCDLFGIKGGKVHMCAKDGKYKGKRLAVKDLVLTPATLLEAAMQYMNAPYLWGGRSVAGIDCSGLTQMAFKMCGRVIPRDAGEQALEGEDVDFLQHAQPGDLAFFDNEDGKITHVGILTDTDHIIHATDTIGRVIIDKIDQGGIVSKLLRKRTHHLRMVKRYI